MKPRWFGPFIIKKIMFGGATWIKIWMGKRCFAQLTRIDSGSTTSKKRRKGKKPTRLKTRKGGLGNN